MKRQIVWVLSGAFLTGCGSFSGLDANSKFGCKAPNGVLCESMTGIYANAERKNLPGQVTSKTTSKTLVSLPGVLTKPVESGTPIRSTPRVLRVWFAPWEDSDGDLHDQSYVYLTIDSGRWLIEHNQQRIRDQYRPIQPPAATSLKPSAASQSDNPALPGEPHGR